MSQTDYTIRVAGRLGGTILAAFPEFDSHADAGSTTLIGPLPDPCAVYDAVARLEALGLEVLELHCASSAPTDCQPAS